MLSKTATSCQPHLDDWLLLPLPPSAAVIERASLNKRIHIRYLYFDVGRGNLNNLKPEDKEIVRAEMRESYERHRVKAIINGKEPIKWRTFLMNWRGIHKGAWHREALARLRGRVEAA